MRQLQFALMLAVMFGFPSVHAYAQDAPSYRNQAAPILQKYCVGCHNSVTTEGGLSLLSAKAITKGSTDGPIISTETPDSSRLLQVITSTGDDHMPPADEPQLSPDELNLLKAWVLAGAPFDATNPAKLIVPEIRVSGPLRKSIISVAVAPGFARIAASSGRGLIQLHDQNDLVNPKIIPVSAAKITDIRFHGTDYLMTAGGVPGLSGTATLYDISQQTPVREFGGHDDLLYAACISSDGRLVATAGYDRKILIHDFESGQILKELNGHNGAVFDLTFSPDNTLLASASADATVKIWHVATGERFDTLSQPLAEQYAVLFSPDGQFIYAAGADNRLRKWKLVSTTAAAINPLVESRFAHEAAITSLAVSPDGSQLASAAEDLSWKVWDTSTMLQTVVKSGDETRVTSLAFLDGNRLVLGTSSGELKLSPTTAEVSSANSASSPTPSTHSVNNAAEVAVIQEAEPNAVDSPQSITIPAKIHGLIHSAESTATPATNSVSQEDQDSFSLNASAGERFLIEVNAQRDKSPLDSRVEILDEQGRPVLQKRLQAVRDSYFTFRGKDSDTSDDFRMFNWQEMELNEYLYADGEVVRLWLYPRGPDSGFKVYPGFDQRFTYFGTTPSSHALQAPAFIVVPREPHEPLVENGLPVFPVYFENDDDPFREWKSDSRLFFQAPADGKYLVRISDARGFSGPDYRYELTVRPPREDFKVSIGGEKISVPKGTGQEISFRTHRIDGYNGPIEISVEGLPPGFSSSLPTTIETEQLRAFATLLAESSAVQPSEEDVRKIRFFGKATIDGQEVVHDLGGLSELKLLEKPKVTLTIHTPEQAAAGDWQHIPELTVYAGETTRAFIKAQRNDFAGHIEFGHEYSGRNMPHGVFVDNIGLNGLMILEGQDQREFFITVAKWVPETSRMFHLSSNVDGITTTPVLLHIRHR